MTSYIEAVEKLIDQQDEKSIRIRELEAKLAKATGFLKTMDDYNKYVIAPFLADLEKTE